MEEWLADVGYSPHYGARLLKHLIQQHVLNPMAVKLLEGAVDPFHIRHVEMNTAYDEELVTDAKTAQTLAITVE